MKGDVIIVGAGAAGLQAAQILRARGRSVLVLEARNRIGGRILTHMDPRIPIPIELGAEFIHGEAPLTRQLLDRGILSSLDVHAEHRATGRGKLRHIDFWPSVENVLGRIDADGPDESMAAFLARRPGGRALARDRGIARRFVEGFHAADPKLISAQSIALPPGESSAEVMRLGRVTQGYQALVGRLARDLKNSLRLGCEVRAIRWRQGNVAVEGRRASGATVRASARAVIITVPIGVLQAPRSARGAITFDPEPTRLREALSGIAIGSALRLCVWFRNLPWKPNGGEQPAFLHFPIDPFQVLWTAYPIRWPFAVVWSGGPSAGALCRKSQAEVFHSMRTHLARAMGLTPASLKSTIRHVWWHNWDRDPYSRGAYSYLKVDGMGAAQALARPEKGTIYFAGEATEESSGTVEAALASGRRAARQVNQALEATG